MNDELNAHQREWLAVLAHELRSPISAVLGYGELLADGTLGTLEQRAADAVERVRQAADQLLRLVEGLEHLSAAAATAVGSVHVCSARELLDTAAAALHGEAEARGTTLHVDDADLQLQTRPAEALRALLLALGAAIKATPGGTLRLHARGGNPPALLISGTRLDPQRDGPDGDSGSDARLTGAALRVGLAQHSARPAQGSIVLEPDSDGVRLELRLPPLTTAGSIDAAEDRP